MENRPKVGICVAIIKDNKILLGLRQGSHGAGTWAYPGGHLEYGESWEACIYREVAEEVGIVIKNLRFGCVTNDVFEIDHKHYVTIGMIADFESGEVQLLEPTKCIQWDWFSWDSLPESLFVTIKNQRALGFDPLVTRGFNLN